MYITFEECIERYPVLSKWAQTDSQVSSGLIYYAEIELNSKLASHFSVPFSGSHPTVKDLTIDLSYIKALRGRDTEKAENLEKGFLERIKRIKSGEEYIYTDSGTAIAPSAGGAGLWSNTKDYNPTHTMLDAESEFTMVDSSDLYNEENLRS